MASEFKIVNIDKHQYFDPSMFGEMGTANGYMNGIHATALAMLACDPGGYTFGSRTAGTWYGDKVQAAYDDALPDTLGVLTSTVTNPSRNLYEMAWREFLDIGPKVICMVCDWIDGTADELASRVVLAPRDGHENLHEYLLWKLGGVAIEEPCSELERSLKKFLGSDWKSKYIKVKVEYDEMAKLDYE